MFTFQPPSTLSAARNHWASMGRWTGAISLICLLAALITGFLPNPWRAAETKAQGDAGKYAALAQNPDLLSWRMSEDPALLRMIIWNGAGDQIFPPPLGMAPLPYEFSDYMIRKLSLTQAEAAPATWVALDSDARELLHCRASPAICLVYERAKLEQALGLRAGRLLTQRVTWILPSALIGLSVAFAIVAMIRRTRTVSPPRKGFQILADRCIAQRGDLEVALTPRDLKLLIFLQDRAGAVVTKDELYDAGWGRDYMPNSRALDQHMITLRRKLDPDKSRPALIETVRGVGYRMLL